MTAPAPRATQSSVYGYHYPEPTDPAAAGAANFADLAGQLRAPELFSGQTPIAGTLNAQNQYRVRHVVYNYSAPTDQYGLMAIPLPFAVCFVTGIVTPRNFRQNVIGIALGQEYCTVTNLCAYPRDNTGNGIPYSNIDVTVSAWGY